jgi:hypothetical protein
MMRRLHLAADPLRSERARKAGRLTAAERKRLHAVLLGGGRRIPTALLSKKLGLKDSTIQRYRRKLGVSLSWHEARAGAMRRNR